MLASTSRSEKTRIVGLTDRTRWPATRAEIVEWPAAPPNRRHDLGQLRALEDNRSSRRSRRERPSCPPRSSASGSTRRARPQASAARPPRPTSRACSRPSSRHPGKPTRPPHRRRRRPRHPPPRSCLPSRRARSPIRKRSWSSTTSTLTRATSMRRRPSVDHPWPVGSHSSAGFADRPRPIRPVRAHGYGGRARVLGAERLPRRPAAAEGRRMHSGGGSPSDSMALACLQPQSSRCPLEQRCVDVRERGPSGPSPLSNYRCRGFRSLPSWRRVRRP